VFANDDVLERPRVAVVNETLARRHWPGSSAIGRQIRLGAVTLTIVGVVGDVQSQTFETERPQQIYVANLQQFEPNMNIAVRVAPGATVSADAIKKAVWAVEPNQPVFNLQPMGELVSELLAEQRFIATLLGAFAALALFMSASGVYTVIAYLVARRTREIAVRIAIGAQARDIVRLVSSQTLGWTIAGLAVGVAGTMVFRGAARAALRGMGDADAATLAALTAFFLLVTIIAMCVPVARMLRLLDPAGALRGE
jgi:ABC-type antimicrobial peptide transport system permease subunit